MEAPIVAHGDDVKNAKSLLIKAVAATDLLEACTSDDIIDLLEDKKKAKMGIRKLVVAKNCMSLLRQG